MPKLVVVIAVASKLLEQLSCLTYGLLSSDPGDVLIPPNKMMMITWGIWEMSERLSLIHI